MAFVRQLAEGGDGGRQGGEEEEQSEVRVERQLGQLGMGCGHDREFKSRAEHWSSL